MCAHVDVRMCQRVRISEHDAHVSTGNVWRREKRLGAAESDESTEEGEECVHAIDAAMICGDDIRRLPYAERRRRLALMISALTRDPAVTEQRPPSPGSAPAFDPYYVPTRKPRGAAAAAAAAAAAPPPDGVRVRLKHEYALHELASAVNAGRARLESAALPTMWPCRGLLLFPGHASPLLPLEPAHEWKKEFSRSQKKEYYYNKVAGLGMRFFG